MSRVQFNAGLLHPRWWFTWLLMGLWWLIAQTPYILQFYLGKYLGRLLLRVGSRRRLISEKNLALCFPECSDEERASLLQQSFESSAIALFETGLAWFAPQWRLRRLVTIEGLEHFEAAKDNGALLMAMHFTTLEIGAAFVSMNHVIAGMYRPHKNAVYDYVQRRGRERHHPDSIAISRRDVRGMLRELKRKQLVWYAPDQDYGPKQSVFAPFFGVNAASVTATSKFTRMTKACVIPFTQTRLDHGKGYIVTVYPPLTDFPSGDQEQDAAYINSWIEHRVRQQPGQYLWSHRRFKTRPPGEADLYGLAKRKPKRRKNYAK